MLERGVVHIAEEAAGASPSSSRSIRQETSRNFNSFLVSGGNNEQSDPWKTLPDTPLRAPHPESSSTRYYAGHGDCLSRLLDNRRATGIEKERSRGDLPSR